MCHAPQWPEGGARMRSRTILTSLQTRGCSGVTLMGFFFFSEEQEEKKENGFFNSKTNTDVLLRKQREWRLPQKGAPVGVD